MSPFISPVSSPPSSPPPSRTSRHFDPAPHSAFDKHTLGGVQFAYIFYNFLIIYHFNVFLFRFGCINVVLASLPPRVLKMVSFFGFSCDRDLGFDLLKKCLQGTLMIFISKNKIINFLISKGGGIRAPLASLFLLSFYVHLPSFVPILMPKCIQTLNIRYYN